ncbi:MAG: HIG1 domain-containing protein [Rickettsiales bacterium]
MLNKIAIILIILTFASIFIGLYHTIKDKKNGKELSNKMMKYRIIFQTLAIIILFFISYYA